VRLVSAAKHAALQQRYERTLRDLEAAEKRAADRQDTIKNLREALAKAEDQHPSSPLPQPEPAVGDTELLRRLRHAEDTIRKLTAQLDQMQATHEADTRELHDLRQGAAS
jgi:uncharacterized membrane protein YccC